MISLAATSITCLPVTVAPVKPILRMRGWRRISSPTVEPEPVTTLKAPGVTPAWQSSSTTRRSVKGVVFAGLTMTAFPATSAGPSLFPNSATGKFHGTMAPQIPMGFFRMSP